MNKKQCQNCSDYIQLAHVLLYFGEYSEQDRVCLPTWSSTWTDFTNVDKIVQPLLRGLFPGHLVDFWLFHTVIKFKTMRDCSSFKTYCYSGDDRRESRNTIFIIQRTRSTAPATDGALQDSLMKRPTSVINQRTPRRASFLPWSSIAVNSSGPSARLNVGCRLPRPSLGGRDAGSESREAWPRHSGDTDLCWDPVLNRDDTVLFILRRLAYICVDYSIVPTLSLPLAFVTELYCHWMFVCCYWYITFSAITIVPNCCYSTVIAVSLLPSLIWLQLIIL